MMMSPKKTKEVPGETDVFVDRGAERRRLEEDASREGNWKRWGPYLSERQWATVREDYSANGESWDYFPHDHARSRTYRWGEDGLLGICDRQCRLAFALALWNGHDPILKERLFGLTGPEGNHGEDVKELYYYLDATPTHSYAKSLYKYPHAAFPYRELVEENRRRGREEREYEILDTGVFDGDRYFDVFCEYAKGAPDDLCIRITVANRGPEAATLHVLPTLWFRNTWCWGRMGEGHTAKPRIQLAADGKLLAEHEELPRMRLAFEVNASGGTPIGLSFRRRARLYSASVFSVRMQRPPNGLAQRSTAFLPRESPRETHSTTPSSRRGCPRKSGTSRARATPRSCIQSSFSTTSCETGLREILRSPRRRRYGDAAATTTGSTSTIATLSPCRTSGSTPGTPPGTWHST